MGQERITYYKKKRQASGLSKIDMAKELGLNYGRYVAIEKGDVKMPSNLIDKFNEIINRGKENEITRIDNNIKADEFWSEMKSLNEKGERRLYEKMREFNISGIEHLASLLGYKSTGTIYSHLTGSGKTSDEFKKRLYDFFNNEINIQIPKKEESVSTKPVGVPFKKPQNATNMKLDRYYDKTNFRKLLKDNDITNTEIANALGVHTSTISNMTRKKIKPGYPIIEGVKRYLDEVLSKKTIDIQLPQIPKLEPKEMVPNYFEETIKEEPKEEPVGVIRRYQSELSEIDEMIAVYKEKIKDLEIRQKVCLEVLNAINELNRIEE